MRKTKITPPSQQTKPDHTTIEFRNCSYVYSPKTPYEFNALNDVSLKFMNHKITAVIGSTGSGKSTLIQHINGLLIPTKGELQVFDFNINAKTKKIKNIRDLRKKIGLVFQFPEYQLFEETVSKDIMFGVRQLNNESFFQKEHDYLYYGLGGRENIVNYKFEGVHQLKVTCHNLANIAKDQLQKTSMQNIINWEQNPLIFNFPKLRKKTVREFTKMYDENTPSHNAKKYVELVGLTEDYLDRSPFDLSGGQKRRIAVAGILAMNGDVLILDEPTAGLDPEGEQEFIALFKRLNIEEQKTIILVTHNMDHVLEIADYIVVMDKGKVVKYDTAVNVFADEQLMKQLEIEPPKIYKILYQLRDEGINLFHYNIKNLSQLTNVLIKMYETKGEVT